MIIDVHIPIWNEEVRLPYVIRHYSQFARYIHIYDNHSNDKSEDIVSVESNVIWHSKIGDDNFDDRFLLDVKNNKWKETSLDADWVICVDADEIIYSKYSVPDFLAKSEEHNFNVINTRGYYMMSEVLPTTTDQIYTELRKGSPVARCDKPTVFNPRQVTDINYTLGAHSCNPVGNNVNILNTEELILLHYKWISFDYQYNRHVEFKNRLGEWNKLTGASSHYHGNRGRDFNGFTRMLNESIDII